MFAYIYMSKTLTKTRRPSIPATVRKARELSNEELAEVKEEALRKRETLTQVIRAHKTDMERNNTNLKKTRWNPFLDLTDLTKALPDLPPKTGRAPSWYTGRSKVTKAYADALAVPGEKVKQEVARRVRSQKARDDAAQARSTVVAVPKRQADAALLLPGQQRLRAQQAAPPAGTGYKSFYHNINMESLDTKYGVQTSEAKKITENYPELFDDRGEFKYNAGNDFSPKNRLRKYQQHKSYIDNLPPGNDKPKLQKYIKLLIEDTKAEIEKDFKDAQTTYDGHTLGLQGALRLGGGRGSVQVGVKPKTRKRRRRRSTIKKKKKSKRRRNSRRR